MIQFAFFLVASLAAAGTNPRNCEMLLNSSRHVEGYEATRVLSLTPTKSLGEYNSSTGLSVVSRNANGEPNTVLVRVLSDNAGNDIRIIGEFNAWGETIRPEDRLTAVANSPYYEARVTGLKHGMQYRLLLNGKQLLDPAADLYSSRGLLEKLGKNSERFLNSVFWDFDRPAAYKMKTTGVDLRDDHIIVGETEIHALVEKWPGANGTTGPYNESDTYRFIATSGVIPELKRMGYNAIEFLPFNMSNDGSAWHFRYQVYGLFAPDSRFGTPDEFAMMMDAFNTAGIGIVMDVVVGHYPFEGNLDTRSLAPIGLHQWKKSDGRNLYGQDMSPWGTYRYDYANPYVRRHLIDSILTIIKRYGISGLRFDNLDGIRFSAGGREFLYELHQELRAYRPEIWTNAEMFFGDKSVTAALDRGGLGLNSRTNSDLFDWFKKHAQGRTQDFDMAALRRALRDPIENWHEGSRTDYTTSHDEAANERDGFTGQYPASLLEGGDFWWIKRKSEVFDGLVLTSGSSTMDMPQMRLLQRGNFSHSPGIDWNLRGNTASEQAGRFLADLSRYVTSNKAFNFRNMSPEIENTTDENSKVMTLMRTDGVKKIYIIINLNDRGFDDYRFGVDTSNSMRQVLNNDSTDYGGSGNLEKKAGGHLIPVEPNGMHQKPHTAVIPYLAPMSILVVETN